MTRDAQEDASFSEQFAALEEAILSGQTPPAIADETSAEDKQRLREAGALLQLLEIDRRISSESGPAPNLDRVLESLGGFKLERVLGRGGYGIVYLARDPKLKRFVALKTPRLDALLDVDLRRRFLHEAQAAAKLHHPNLIPIFEVGEEGPHCFLVSHYCPAGSLADFLRNADKPVPIPAAVELVAKIADAVGYMHGRGLLHRDIKPSNILLEGQVSPDDAHADCEVVDLATMNPRLSDFGLVKAFGPAEQAALSASLGGNGILGTPEYMAPEQAQNEGKDIGPAADVYSLGATLYELLTGHQPFSGSNLVELLDKVLSHDPAPLRPQRAGIKRDLETICLKCLAKRPEDRYAKAELLAADLRRVLAGEPVLGRRPSVLRRAWRALRRKPLVPVAAGLGLGLICTVAYFAAQISLRDRSEAKRIRQAEYSQIIHQVDEGLRTGKRAGINELLNRLRPGRGEDDLRGFEWYYLWQEMWNQGPVWLVNERGALCYSSDGRVIATDNTRSLFIWDAATGNQLASHPFKHKFAGKIAFSLTGNYLSFIAKDETESTVRVFDGGLKGEVWAKSFGKVDMYAILVAQDDRTIVTVDKNRVSLFDVKDRATPGMCFYQSEPSRSILSGSISLDGNLIAIITSDKELRWWDRTSHRLIGTSKIVGPLNQIIAIAPNNEFLAFSSQKEIRVIAARDGRLIKNLAVDLGNDFEIQFSRDNRYLLTATYPWKNKAKAQTTVWDLESGQSLLAISDQNVHQVVLLPNLSAVAIRTDLGSQPTIQIVRFALRVPTPILSAKHGETWAVAFAPDGRTLASGGDDGNVRLWNVASGSQTRLLPHGQLVGTLAFSPDGKVLATGSDDNKVRFWDPNSGILLGEFSMLAMPARFLHFSHDSRLLAVGERSENVVILDARTREEAFRFSIRSDRVKGLNFSHDSSVLYAGDDNGYLSLWDVRRRKLKTQILTHSQIRRVCISPSGKLLATAHKDGTVALRDATNGSELQILRGHQEEVLALAFDAEGRTLASAGNDHSVMLWRCTDGQQLLRLAGPTLQVNDLAFSADGKTLAAACHDGNVYLWRGAVSDSELPVYEPAVPLLMSNLDFATHRDVSLPSAPACLAAGNIENNGGDNLAVLCPEVRRLFRIAPDRELHAVQTQMLPENSSALVLADFNKNGELDLAVVNVLQKCIDVHWSNHDAKFARLSSVGHGQVHSFLVGSDINNDGQIDLLTTNPLTNTVSVFISSRPDRFDPVSSCVTGKSPCHISVADLNGDGNGDMVVAESADDAVSVYLGKGDATFSTRTTLGNLRRPTATAVADFNNDGKPDIAVVQENGDSVTIFLNKGAAQFARNNELPVGTGCCSIIAADLDEDGTVDLAVVNPATSMLSVLRGKGDGTFDPAKHYPTGKGPISLLALDLDQDGFKDLVVCCKEGKCVAIHYGKKGK